LKNFEFELPEMDQQKKLADVLWAIDDTKKAYQNLIQKTDELVKSQFIGPVSADIFPLFTFERRCA